MSQRLGYGLVSTTDTVNGNAGHLQDYYMCLSRCSDDKNDRDSGIDSGE